MRREEPARIDLLLRHVNEAPATLAAVSGAENEKRSALVYIVPPISGHMILPTSRYIPGKPGTQIRVTGARGEYEPATLCVRAGT